MKHLVRERVIGPLGLPPKHSHTMHLDGIEDQGIPKHTAIDLLEMADRENILEKTHCPPSISNNEYQIKIK